VTNVLSYKSYLGEVEIDATVGVLHGRVVGLRDTITFEGLTVEEVVQAFHDSVDDYLAFCAERGEEPDKPYSGNLPFRTTPEVHRRIALAAAASGKSINAWLSDAAAEAADRTLEQRAS
jgi:predicted HicB family RNase H-like nuclease